jgi:hypothetical protein
MINCYPITISGLKQHISFIVLLFIALPLFAQTPVITGFSPASGAVGTTVTITGSNFGATANDNSVYFGAAQASIIAASTSSLTVQVPSGATSGTIMLQGQGGQGYSSKSFKVSYESNLGLTTRSFTGGGSLSTAGTGYPAFAAAADFDGDGSPDVALANYKPSEYYYHYLYVDRNVSTKGAKYISFGSPSIIDNKAIPTGLATGDIDGDGKLDMVASYNYNVVGVYRNTTTGTNISFEDRDFVAGSTSLVLRGLAIGDIDGDGLADLALVTDSSTLVVFRNTSTPGNVSFASPVSFPVGAGPQTVALGDMDGDHLSDVVTANATANTISVLRNTSIPGTISFATANDFAVQQQPMSATLGDLNGDGALDVAVANFASSSVSILQNNSTNGNIAFAARKDYPGATAAFKVAIEDFNNDGKPDLAIVLNSDATDACLLAENTSNGTTFSLGAFVTLTVAGNNTNVVTSDFNSDGKPDLVFTAWTTFVFENQYDLPYITGATPLSAGAGQSVTILGGNFDHTSSVVFGLTPADSFRVISPGKIVAYVGVGSSGDVNVTTPGGTVHTGPFYYNSTAVINSVTPLTAAPGDVVTIKGYSLDGTIDVSFGGVPAASFTVNSPTTISAVVGAGRSGDVSAYGSGGTALSPGFVFKGAPSISSFTPTSSSIGATVTITGNDFIGTTAVKFGNVPVDTFVVESPTTITAVLGSGASGSVSVTTPYGTATQAGFTFVPLPTVTDFTPVAADTNQIVTIYGTNFINVSEVDFAYIPSDSFYVVSPTQINARVTTGASGAVVVRTSYGVAWKDGFTFTSSPVISSITPLIGDPGTKITINGANFNKVKSVSVGGFADPLFTVVSPAKITATVGAVGYGTWPVKVNVAKDSVSYTGFYTGITVSSISPVIAATGSTVTITGTHFSTVATDNIVYFGAVRATVNNASAASLTVTVPAGATVQPVSVTVGGLTAYSSQTFLPRYYGADTAFNAQSFATRVDYSLGATPAKAVFSDLNGDGLADVLLPYGSTVGVFKNTSQNGTLSLAPMVTFGSGSSITSTIVADFDGDGKPDVIAPSYYSGTMAILKNTSTLNAISFAPQITFATSCYSRDMAVGDFDGDGKLDLALANYSPTVVVILKNTSQNGVISFTKMAVTYPVVNDCFDIVANDMDGDGKADLAYVNTYSAIVSVLRNTSVPGTISFDNKTDYPTTGVVSRLTTGDVDGDGKEELVVTWGSTVSIFRNNSRPGKIVFMPKVDFATPSTVVETALSDFNGDGKLDIVAGDNNFSVFKNNSTPGNISLAASFDYLAYGISQVTAGDLDNDGKADVIGINPINSMMFVLRNKGNITDEPVITNFLPASAFAGSTIKISGINLTGTTKVGFGDTLATSFTVVSDSVINAVVSTGASGKVFVTSPKGTSVMSGFTILPDMISFSPATAKMNDTVTITGTGFTAPLVRFGGIYGKVVSTTSTTIKVIVPDAVSGDVILMDAEIFDTLHGFTYIPPAPVITSFTPAIASAGATVTFTGTYFTNVTAVSFGGVPADSIIRVSSTTLQAVVGTTGASGNVSITTASGTVTKSGFTWMVAPPVINSFTPAGGYAGTAVTITGTGFNTIAGNNIVYFGAVKAAVTNASATSLTVTVPTGATYQPITVANNNFTAYSTIPFAVTFPDHGTLSAGSFGARIIIPALGNPANVVPVDLDGDQKIDLAIPTGEHADSLMVLKNTGALSFVSQYRDHVDGTDAYMIDLNGDGKQDLAFPSDYSDYNSATYIQNTTSGGTITFGVNTTVPAIGLSWYNMTTGDLDWDGRPDLIIASQNSAGVSFGKNTSIGGVTSFEGLTRLVAPGTPSSVVVGDLDGDRKPELIVAAAGYGIYVYKNTSTRGTVSFAAGVSCYAGGGFGKLAVADVDGDGKPDILCSTYNKTVVVVPNKGALTFGAAQFYPVGDYATSIAVGDLDGDGKPDVAVPSAADGTVSVLHNTSTPGTINFDAKISYAAGANPKGIAIADMNSDGKPDLLVTNYTAGTVSILLNVINNKNTVITSFKPAAAAKDSIVTISGQHLTGATSVSFGGVAAASFTVVSDSVITAKVGTGATGKVSVSAPLGVDSLSGFTFLPVVVPPVVVLSISGFSPLSGDSGTVVTIQGHHFTNVTSVNFGGTSALFTIVSDSVITATVGAGASGAVTVATADTTVALAGFTFIPPVVVEPPVIVPSINSFSPLSGDSGTVVTIYGYNFTNITSVSFGGTSAVSFNIVSDTVMTAIVGAGTTGAVSVVTADTTVSLTGFTFVTPVVNNLSVYPNPASGIVSITHPAAVNATKIQIVDMMGNLLKTYSVSAGESKTTIDVSTMAIGTYRVVWINGSDISSKGIMVVQ